MLNQRLPRSELEQSLKEYINSVDFILKEISYLDSSIIFNKDIMGKLHHALNISNYANSDFRKNLLKHANEVDLKKFMITIGLAKSTITNEEMVQLIPKAASFSWGDNNETKSFAEIFGYEQNIIPKYWTKNETREKIKASEKPLKTLKEYQTKIFFESIKLVENPWTRFIIKMPTGAGKTRTALEVVSHFLNTGLEKDEKRQVVWIADREELCEQAIEAMQEIWPHIGKEELNLYRMWGGAKIEKFEDFSFIVATYQTLNSMLKNNKSFPTPHLVISDEAHSVLAPTHQGALRKLEENGTRIVGLTATPIRGIDTSENQKLQEYFNGQLIEIDSGEINAIEFLQGEGYLSHYIPITVPSNRQFNLNMHQRRKFEDERDLPSGLLDEIAADNKRNIKIAEILKDLKEKNSQVLYFAPNVKQSKFMCALLLALGAKVAHVDGNSPSAYRKDVVEKFRRGEINFIFNYNVFSTGFDAPNIDVVFIARPTTSIVLHQQMIGRGMRGPEMGGTETFKLFRILDELPAIDLADEYFSEIWGRNNND